MASGSRYSDQPAATTAAVAPSDAAEQASSSFVYAGTSPKPYKTDFWPEYAEKAQHSAATWNASTARRSKATAAATAAPRLIGTAPAQPARVSSRCTPRAASGFPAPSSYGMNLAAALATPAGSSRLPMVVTAISEPTRPYVSGSVARLTITPCSSRVRPRATRPAMVSSRVTSR
ncbi:hypothetical protein Prum_082680 [Phytohabitans rumicis]|uniref:Uncharacterized protein n=1 Tax=Phytohabitans rumicis TaxID=1076125 RepID=A0A6V8LKC8_9ACTN|nr:hypothetical protein [Phytohabitans rumicis]GFJ94626.1 hypothetical protein Prum_082680 [Phytohabitans rumicis]